MIDECETWSDGWDNVTPIPLGSDDDPSYQAPNGYKIEPSPFGSDPVDIAPPPRDFVYGKHYARGYLSMSMGDTGVAKSTHVITESVAMTSGRRLLGVDVPKPLRVAYLNAEDTRADLSRKVNAVMKHYGVTTADLQDHDGARLLLLGMGQWQAPRSVSDFDALHSLIKTEVLDVVFLDPWVSMHQAGENANEEVDLYAKRLSQIAAETECCISVVHHKRKGQPGVDTHATTDDARGASSLRAACRSARVFSRMNAKDAQEFTIEEEDRASFYFIHRDNSNIAPVGNRKWHRLLSVSLDNATDKLPADEMVVPVVVEMENYAGAPDDTVKVATRTLANLQASGTRFRTDHQAKPPETWLGDYILDACGLEADDAKARKWVKTLIKSWEKSGTIVKGWAPGPTRHERPYYWLCRRLDITGADADLEPCPYSPEPQKGKSP